MLTEREKEIFGLINEGFTYVDIAMKLDISVHSVKALACSIERKLKLNSSIVLKDISKFL